MRRERNLCLGSLFKRFGHRSGRVRSDGRPDVLSGQGVSSGNSAVFELGRGPEPRKLGQTGHPSADGYDQTGHP